METHFVRWMKFFGKPYSEFKMYSGDFLSDQYRPIIQNSTTIFVNNFAFGPTLNHKLKERFAMLPEGVKIISSAEFRPINFRITTRNITGRLLKHIHVNVYIVQGEHKLKKLLDMLYYTQVDLCAGYSPHGS